MIKIVKIVENAKTDKNEQNDKNEKNALQIQGKKWEVLLVLRIRLH